jgi:hypothetical protein
LLWPTFYSKSASKDNKQVHNEFYEKIRKELNVTNNYTNQKTKRTVISTTKRMKMKPKEMIVLSVESAKKFALNSMKEWAKIRVLQQC